MSSIARSAHVLKAQKSLEIPRHFIFFDTETEQHKSPNGDVTQTFKLGWAVYYRRRYIKHPEQTIWQYIDTPDTFWRFVFTHAEPKQRLWIIARNVCFDFTVCKGWDFMHREGYKHKFFFSNGVSVILQLCKGNSTIVFLDSMNWFTESLEKTGERIRIPKMKIDFATCTWQELSDYCKNDVRIELVNFQHFIRFLEGNCIAKLCYTKASTAMAAYLFRHYHTPIYIHNNGEACRLEREAYKGGRCECFYIGDLNHERYTVLDVNSLYPFVMRDGLFPVKYVQLCHAPTLTKFKAMVRDSCVVAKVQVTTTEPVYAVKNKRTIFPVGVFDTVLCTPELTYALEHKHITRVYDVVTYEQAKIFTSYVNTMYALRKDFASAGVKEYEQLCKYLLNSLYGKFGQKAENWVKIGDAPNEPDREEILLSDGIPRCRRLRYLLGELWELKGYGEAYNSFPGIAAHVTAYARMYLWQLMKVCGQGNYFYCDTDSLIVNEKGFDNLSAYVDDAELGKLKTEYVTYSLTIRGLKDYITDAKTVIKGVRKNAVQIADGVYTQQQWPTFKGLLKTDDCNTYTVKQVTKHLSRDYTKGTVTLTGKVIPFSLLPI